MFFQHQRQDGSTTARSTASSQTTPVAAVEQVFTSGASKGMVIFTAPEQTAARKAFKSSSRTSFSQALTHHHFFHSDFFQQDSSINCSQEDKIRSYLLSQHRRSLLTLFQHTVASPNRQRTSSSSSTIPLTAQKNNCSSLKTKWSRSVSISGTKPDLTSKQLAAATKRRATRRESRGGPRPRRRSITRKEQGAPGRRKGKERPIRCPPTSTIVHRG